MRIEEMKSIIHYMESLDADKRRLFMFEILVRVPHMDMQQLFLMTQEVELQVA